MALDTIDWTLIIGFLVVTLAVGLAVTKRAGRSSADFFLAGRGMPWWLLGMSMVATTFSAGTPNFVTDVVRQQGVAGNWIWWAFLLTGMMTVFVYAKLWRRSGVITIMGGWVRCCRKSSTSWAVSRGRSAGTIKTPSVEKFFENSEARSRALFNSGVPFSVTVRTPISRDWVKT